MSQSPPNENIFDLRKTECIYQLCDVPVENREDAWLKRFLENIPHASMAAGEPQVAQGPDGLLYFQLFLPPEAEEFEPFSVVHLLEFLCENGYGITVNPQKDGQVDYVFSFGDIWNFRETGSFYGELAPALKNADSTEGENSVLIAQPSEEYLPHDVRNAIARDLQNTFGIAEPALFLMIHSEFSPSMNLVFNLFPDSFDDKGLYEFAQTYLRWVLPNHYGLVFLSHEDEYADSFAPLSIDPLAN